MSTTHGPCAWPIAAGALFFHAALIAQCPPGATMPRDLSLATTLPESGPATTRRVDRRQLPFDLLPIDQRFDPLQALVLSQPFADKAFQ